MAFARRALWNLMQSQAPSFLSFESRRRVEKSGRARRAGADAANRAPAGTPWTALLLALVALLGWLWARRKELRLRRAAALASETPLSSLADLRRALRGPRAREASDAEASEQPCADARRGPGTCTVTVLSLAGTAVWGPAELDVASPAEGLLREVAAALSRPPAAVTLLSGAKALRPSRPLSAAGLEAGGAAELTAVVSTERVEIADSLYARVVGNVQVPGNGWVTAPFSGERVAYYEATVVRLYDEWVTRWERRCVKRGRAEGSLGKDDPGSDSEYEEVERSSWEPQEEVQERRSVAAARIVLDDGSGESVQLVPQDLEHWARENAELAFSQTEEPPPAALGLGAQLLRAAVDVERERGLRREERCLRLGERTEAVGEAVAAGDGLVLREPQLASERLHRVDSLTQDPAEPTSALQGKAFLASVLRGRPSLESLLLGRALWWRVGKWLSGLLALLLAAYVGRRARDARRQRLRELAASVAGRCG